MKLFDQGISRPFVTPVSFDDQKSRCLEVFMSKNVHRFLSTTTCAAYRELKIDF